MKDQVVHPGAVATSGAQNASTGVNTERSVAEREAEVSAARRALQSVETIARQEADAARAAVMDRHRELIAEKRAEVSAAERALRDALDATPDHPWTGRRVFRMEPVGRSYDRRPDVRLEGVVETYRSTTALPANTASYRAPRIGDGIVRLLKKDGAPGIKMERLERGSYRPWQLCDADAAEGAPLPDAEVGPGRNQSPARGEAQ